MRFLIAKLLNPGKPVGFDNIETLAPDIYAHPARSLKTIPGPRLLKSHEYFDPRYRTVIYIVRDPRDVAISYWNHHIKFKLIDRRYPIQEFIDKYLKGELDPFGTWQEHVGSWLGAREGNDRFLLLRYEDMLADPTSGAKQIASHLGLNLTDVHIEEAIESSSFRIMKAKEKEQGGHWLPTKNSFPDLPFIREGKSQQWKNKLEPHLAEKIANNFGHQMQRLGYSNG